MDRVGSACLVSDGLDGLLDRIRTKLSRRKELRSARVKVQRNQPVELLTSPARR